jgi:hypothetical protein
MNLNEKRLISCSIDFWQFPVRFCRQGRPTRFPIFLLPLAIMVTVENIGISGTSIAGSIFNQTLSVHAFQIPKLKRINPERGARKMNLLSPQATLFDGFRRLDHEVAIDIE